MNVLKKFLLFGIIGIFYPPSFTTYLSSQKILFTGRTIFWTLLLLEYLFQIWFMSYPWVHTNYLSPPLKKNHNKLLLLFASVQFHVYFLSLFVWHMFEPISWSASKYFKELIQCEICSSIYRYINDDAFFVALSKNLCFFFFFR